MQRQGHPINNSFGHDSAMINPLFAPEVQYAQISSSDSSSLYVAPWTSRRVDGELQGNMRLSGVVKIGYDHSSSNHYDPIAQPGTWDSSKYATKNWSMQDSFM